MLQGCVVTFLDRGYDSRGNSYFKPWDRRLSGRVAVPVSMRPATLSLRYRPGMFISQGALDGSLGKGTWEDAGSMVLLQWLI